MARTAAGFLLAIERPQPYQSAMQLSLVLATVRADRLADRLAALTTDHDDI